MRTFRSVVARVTVLATVAVAATVIFTGSAHAATGNWAAIAVSVRTGNLGYVYDYSSAGGARSAAVDKCSAGDCQAVVWASNGCVAVAQAPNLAWGWAYGPSRSAAENQAVSATPGDGARVLAWACTTRYQ